MHHNKWKVLTLLASAVTLAACNGGSSDDDKGNDNDQGGAQPLVLNIAHINDQHSNLEAFAGTELILRRRSRRAICSSYTPEMPSPVPCITPFMKAKRTLI